MEKNLPYFAVFFVLIYALYNGVVKNKENDTVQKSKTYIKHTKIHKTEHYEEEFNEVLTTEYLKDYIIRVINHGSNQFDFTGGEMEGEFAQSEDAAKIACYVMEFSGKKCKTLYEKNAAMLYSSNCGGCHGNDGKGINGTFPDLTKEKFLGIKKREEELKSIRNKTHEQ